MSIETQNNTINGSKDRDDSRDAALKTYWRSLEELAGDSELEEARHQEFLTSPLKEENTESDEYTIARRKFLKLMGAGIALASTACAKRPMEKIIPYVNKPEEVTPGVANWYASTCAECSSGCGVLVKTREGRPIKFEGNPDHPQSLGGLCARGQASVLNLYDPVRLSETKNAEEADARIVGALKAARSGGKVRVLSGELGPSTQTLVNDFLGQFAGSKHVVYEPLSEEETVKAQQASYDSAVFPRYRFDKAKVVVTFGADFLGTWGNVVENQKLFSKARKVDSVNSKQASPLALYVFEPMMSLTGSNADVRQSVAPGDQLAVALAVANEVILKHGVRYAGDSSVKEVLATFTAEKVAQQTGVDLAVLKVIGEILVKHKGQGIVLGGGVTGKGAFGEALETVVNLINSALDNEGTAIDGTVNPSHPLSSTSALTQLVDDMNAGKVDVLFMYKTNPVYTLEKALGFSAALKKVKLVVNVAQTLDETGEASHIVVADHHELEKWGDHSSGRGVYSLRQPTISPLYPKTRAFQDSLILWAKGAGASGKAVTFSSWYDYLKNQWQGIQKEVGSSDSFAGFWDNTLRSGVAFNKNSFGQNSRARSFKTASLKTVLASVSKREEGLRLVVYSKVGIADGRTANNSWLQEFPDPVTRITWGNYASVAPSYAKTNSLKDGDLVKITTSGGSLTLPVHVQPGNHAQTVSVAMGYGRHYASDAAIAKTIGVNVFDLVKKGSAGLEISNQKVELVKAGGFQALASTQQHHLMEGRGIVREATVSQFQKNPGAGNRKEEHLVTLWPEHKYEGYRWAMSIDLNSCTGCGSCVVGCQAENNIPVVGPKDILNGREMHWLRIDRYYSGMDDNPEAVFQPMLCQHCENAPCETVCPVLATMHDDEGLNQQAYNRCVGTRYCANNCPYKVRRFNWYTYTDVKAPLHMQYNPDITVRTRGVMEKCNFCTQRIREAKHRAKDMGRKVLDGEIKTACQQSCPTDAISFGNINDHSSTVARFAEDPRGYRVLEELNVKPSITYLTKIRNK